MIYLKLLIKFIKDSTIKTSNTTITVETNILIIKQMIK